MSFIQAAYAEESRIISSPKLFWEKMGKESSDGITLSLFSDFTILAFLVEISNFCYCFSDAQLLDLQVLDGLLL